MLIATLTTSFMTGIQNNPAVPAEVKSKAQVELASGVPFVSDADLKTALDKAGVPTQTANAIVDENATARITGLRSSLSVLAVIALIAVFFSLRIPTEQPLRDAEEMIVGRSPRDLRRRSPRGWVEADLAEPETGRARAGGQPPMTFAATLTSKPNGLDGRDRRVRHRRSSTRRRWHGPVATRVRVVRDAVVRGEQHPRASRTADGSRRPRPLSDRRAGAMKHTSVDIYLVIDTFLLLLIGIGPKIALVPFVEITAPLDGATKALIVRKMLTTAAVVALILVGLGEFLSRLLHFSTGSLSIAGGIILFIIAITMVRGSAEPDGNEAVTGRDPMRIAVFPLAIPYLLNPAGIVALVTLSAEADSVAVFAMVLGVLAVVLALDVAVFRLANRASDHLDESRMLVTEKIFGILLAALAVQLVLDGLDSVGVIHLTGH